MLLYVLVIVAVSLAGGVLPLVLRRTDRMLHAWIALATGVFLGAVFLHLLPQVAQLGQTAAAENGDGRAHGGHGAGVWLYVLIGVLALYLLETLALARDGGSERGQHVTVGYASFLGLCVHAFTEGVGLAAASVDPELSAAVFVSILSHKFAETFSLSTVYLLARFGPRRILALTLAYALVTPAGVLLGQGLLPGAGLETAAVLTGLAAGTFLFVALCDLLPEVFHHREDVALKIALLAAGVLLSLVVHPLGEA